MDFSLLQQGAKNAGLRDIMAFGSQKWMYYSIIVIDPILRFSWIFLAIFTRNIQHGSIVAFLVAFVEVTRRGAWTLFRVENEHCTNISQQKASRDVPLPYKMKEDFYESSELLSASLTGHYEMVDIPEGINSPSARIRPHIGDTTPLIESGYVSSGRYYGSGNSAARGLLRGLSRRLANAHTQDFQRRKKLGSAELDDESRELNQALQSNEWSDAEEDGDCSIPEELSEGQNVGGNSEDESYHINMQ